MDTFDDTPNNKRYTVQLRVSAEEAKALDFMAWALRTSKSQLIRTLFSNKFEQVKNDYPVLVHQYDWDSNED